MRRTRNHTSYGPTSKVLQQRSFFPNRVVLAQDYRIHCDLRVYEQFFPAFSFCGQIGTLAVRHSDSFQFNSAIFS